MHNLAHMIFDMFFFVKEPDKVLALAESMFLLSTVILFFIMPIVFNFLIIPKVEKKLGQKLVFPFKLYDAYPLSKSLGKHIEIAIYIFVKFLGIKKEPNSNFALSKMNNIFYEIKMSSKFEIFVVIVDVVALTAFLIGLIVGIIRFESNSQKTDIQKYYYSQKFPSH